MRITREKVKSPPLVVIVGETASGKSASAIDLARKFNGEIISADSWQVYRGFDIGTAKPNRSEQAEVSHHLIDIRDADEGFSAAVYKDLANQAIKAITKRGKLPIMVGGTGLYIDSVLFDFSFLPPGDPEVRTELRKLSISELLHIISDRKISIVGIDTRNKRRLIRLLETKGQRPTSSATMRPNTLVVGIRLPRGQLRENIEKRVNAMFRRGLKYEVEKLAAKYGWEAEAMKGIGYREFKDFFAGKQSLAATRRKIVKSTLELAKRQRTWFKRHREIKWIDDPKAAITMTATFIR